LLWLAFRTASCSNLRASHSCKSEVSRGESERKDKPAWPCSLYQQTLASARIGSWVCGRVNCTFPSVPGVRAVGMWSGMQPSPMSTVSPQIGDSPSCWIDTGIAIGQRKDRRRSRRIKPCAPWRVRLIESKVNGLSSTKLEPALNAAALSSSFLLIAKATAVRFREAGRRISRKNSGCGLT